MATNSPDPRATTRGFVALVLDQARIDPDRRPRSEMRQWCVDIAEQLGSTNSVPLDTTYELLQEALRLERVAHMICNGDTEPPTRELSEFNGQNELIHHR